LFPTFGKVLHEVPAFVPAVKKPVISTVGKKIIWNFLSVYLKALYANTLSKFVIIDS
jgi:hypothetical protein